MPTMKSNFTLCVRGLSLLPFFLALIFSAPLPGQISWVQTNGPFNGDVERLFIHPLDGQLLAMTEGKVYRGLPPGPFWSPVIFDPNDQYWYDLVKADDQEYYLVGVSGVVGHTTDFGITWDLHTLPVSIIDVLRATPDGRALLYTGTNDFYFTEDHGQTWNLQTSDLGVALLTLLYDPSTDFFFAGTSEGIWASADNGSTWTAMNNGDMTNTTEIRTLHRIDISGTLLANTGSQTYRSTDGGVNWTLLPGFLFANHFDDLGPDAVYAACGFSGLYRSSVDGLQWKPVTGTGLPELCQLVTVKGGQGEIYVSGSDKEGLLLAADPDDPEWVLKGMPNEEINALHYDEGSGTILAATNDTVFRSTDLGQTWIRSNEGLTYPFMTGFTTKPGKIYVWSTWGNIHVSEDAGVTWTDLSANVPGTFIQDMTSNQSTRLFLASSGNEAVYVAHNQDLNWGPYDQGLPDQINIEKLAVTGVPGPNQWLFGASVFGMYRTTAGLAFANWQSFGNGLPAFQMVYDLKSSPGGTTLLLSGEAGLFQSSTTVDFWTTLPVPPDALPIHEIHFVSENQIMIATPNGIYLSEDGGQSWDQINNTLVDIRTTSVIAAGKDHWLAGTQAGGVHLGTGKIVAVEDVPHVQTAPHIWPNPAQNLVYLSGHYSESGIWEVSDVLGRRQHLSCDWSDDQVVLDVNELDNGIWWIHHEQFNIPIIILR